MKKIMFVCTGNTCRSPMAEYLLKKIIKERGLTDIKVTSGGIKAVEGDSINEKARAALKGYGVTVRRFVCKRATKELCRKQNAVVCMTSGICAAFRNFTNVYSMAELTGSGDIADPYGGTQEDYNATAKQLYEACSIICDLLSE